MGNTWSGWNLLIGPLAVMGVSVSAFAASGYSEAIDARTRKNTDVTGQWYELKSSDWAFYEGEAASRYNMGAIPAGTKVEVLKMNKQMARVRLPDGRVVFVRNRLLDSSAAPSASERQSQATRTADIGKTKLHGGSPYARPAAADVSSTGAPLPPKRPAGLGQTNSAVVPLPPKRPSDLGKADSTLVPLPPKRPVGLGQTNSAVVPLPPKRPADLGEKNSSAMPLPPKRPAELSKADSADVPLPPKRPADLGKADSGDVPLPPKRPADLGKADSADVPLPPKRPADLGKADSAEVPLPPKRPAELSKADSAEVPLPPKRPANLGKVETTEVPLPPKRPADLGKADSAAENKAATSTSLPETAPLPPSRPADLGQEAAATPASAKCDPKKQWQPPVRQTFRITDCLGGSRDGGGRRHAGVDIAGENPGMRGLPIYPSASGEVIRSGHNGAYGCFIEIAHETCPDSIAKWRRKQGCVTRYAHLATKTYKDNRGRTRVTCDVPEVGTEVTSCGGPGDKPIGRMSGTGAGGRANDYAAHLHFELRDHSTSVAYNPNTLIASLRGAPHFKSQGSASCRASDDVDAAEVSELNSGRISRVAKVRAEEGRE